MPSASTLTQMIKAEATNLGFNLFGVTLPHTPPHFASFKNWVANSQHAGMAYLARESALKRRENPASNLDGCQSIIVLGFPYPGPFSNPPLEVHHPHGRVAAYAWGFDYHAIAMQRANQLIGFSRSLAPEGSFRAYVDTGPILERDLAQMAGLGWIGKNTCLISPKTGSYFFLLEIFTNLPLSPSIPFEADRCGSCRMCIDNCPTRCISSDRTIDSRRCISYLTIENRGPIPVELRASLGKWVFGCDLCQIVCPWNKKHWFQVGDPALRSYQQSISPALLSELTLTRETFAQRFGHSPIKRAGRSGYLRNVATALGNQVDPEHLPIIVDAINLEEDLLVRSHLYWTLSRIGTHKAKAALEKYAGSELEPEALAEISLGLTSF